MGYGDEVMATGLARGAKTRGRRVAFGNGRQIIYGPWSEEVFRHNPNIAPPGSEGAADLEWVQHYKGHRLYNSMSSDRQKWIWNYSFKATPGEFYFSTAENSAAAAAGEGFILVEPNVPWQKAVAVNKDWGIDKYQELVRRLIADREDVVQLSYGRDRLHGVRTVMVSSFRSAVAVLARAKAAVLPEGGLHHSAAAVGVRGVVVFGGFIPPAVTGYALHVNLTGGAEACGTIGYCSHCREAMARITVDDVYEGLRSVSPR